MIMLKGSDPNLGTTVIVILQSTGHKWSHDIKKYIIDSREWARTSGPQCVIREFWSLLLIDPFIDLPTAPNTPFKLVLPMQVVCLYVRCT